MDLTGAHCLVTGAASGIGRATALAFARHGARRIACLDLHDGGNADTVRQIEELGAAADAFHLDLGEVKQIRAVYRQVLEQFGHLDAAVHIGGYSWQAESLDVDEAQWDRFIDVNLKSTFFCCQEALRAMYARKRGAVVNMSADAAFYPMSGLVVQAAGKGGIAALSRVLALEAAPFGVRVNVVSPGPVHVQPSGEPKPKAPPLRARKDSPRPSLEAMAKLLVAGCLLTADEVAEVIAFLCSDAASGINGSVQFVNGGGYFAFEY